MSDGEDETEFSHELEVYAEATFSDLGIAPRVGMKLTRTRKLRVRQMLEAAAESADLSTDELGERAASDDAEHLRALFGFFFYGMLGSGRTSAALDPRIAERALARLCTDAVLAHQLRLSKPTTTLVILRLDTDGYIVRGAGEVVAGGQLTHSVAEWGGRVLSLVFPHLKIEMPDPPVERPTGFVR